MLLRGTGVYAGFPGPLLSPVSSTSDAGHDSCHSSISAPAPVAPGPLSPGALRAQVGLHGAAQGLMCAEALRAQVGLHGADQSLICVRLLTLLLRAAQARAIAHNVSFAATAGFELPTMGP